MSVLKTKLMGAMQYLATVLHNITPEQLDELIAMENDLHSRIDDESEVDTRHVGSTSDEVGYRDLLLLIDTIVAREVPRDDRDSEQQRLERLPVKISTLVTNRRIDNNALLWDLRTLQNNLSVERRAHGADLRRLEAVQREAIEDRKRLEDHHIRHIRMVAKTYLQQGHQFWLQAFRKLDSNLPNLVCAPNPQLTAAICSMAIAAKEKVDELTEEIEGLLEKDKRTAEAVGERGQSETQNCCSEGGCGSERAAGGRSY